MTPVTGGITDAEEDGFILAFRYSKCILIPRQPVHGMVRMLKQIRRFFVDQTVRFPVRLHNITSSQGLVSPIIPESPSLTKKRREIGIPELPGAVLCLTLITANNCGHLALLLGKDVIADDSDCFCRKYPGTGGYVRIVEKDGARVVFVSVL